MNVFDPLMYTCDCDCCDGDDCDCDCAECDCSKWATPETELKPEEPVVLDATKVS